VRPSYGQAILGRTPKWAVSLDGWSVIPVNRFFH
jgi:hypothetical protein